MLTYFAPNVINKMQRGSRDTENRQVCGEWLTGAKDVIVVEMFTEVVTYLTHQVCETPECVCLCFSCIQWHTATRQQLAGHTSPSCNTTTGTVSLMQSIHSYKMKVKQYPPWNFEASLSLWVTKLSLSLWYPRYPGSRPKTYLVHSLAIPKFCENLP